MGSNHQPAKYIKKSIKIHQPVGSGALEPWNFMTFHSVGNGIIIPTDFHSMIFQRARAKNHQPEGIPYKSPLNPIKSH